MLDSNSVSSVINFLWKKIVKTGIDVNPKTKTMILADLDPLSKNMYAYLVHLTNNDHSNKNFNRIRNKIITTFQAWFLVRIYFVSNNTHTLKTIDDNTFQNLKQSFTLLQYTVRLNKVLRAPNCVKEEILRISHISLRLEKSKINVLTTNFP